MDLKSITKKVCREHLAYMAIAVIGVLSSIVTLFIDIDQQVTIKWLLFSICIYLITVIFLLRVLFEIAVLKGAHQKIKIIKYYHERSVLAIRCTADMPINTMLSVYIQSDDYEELFALAYIENKQENGLYSARISRVFADSDESLDLRKRGIIKTTLPYNILTLESYNE